VRRLVRVATLGLVLALAYSLGIVVMSFVWPRSVYAGGAPQPVDAMELMPVGLLLRKLVPSVLMIVLVLGGLYAGYFTATEAGAVGAALALVIALLALPALVLKQFFSPT